MFRHNLLIIFRNFKRNKSSFFINLIGLCTGLAYAVLSYLYVNNELNVDKLHEKDSQLFQAMKNSKNYDGRITVGTQAIKAVLANPIESLSYE